MSSEPVRLLRRVNRDANALVVRVVGGRGSPGADDELAFERQLADLHYLAVSGLAAEHRLPRRVVIDLRPPLKLSDRMAGELLRLDRFLRAVQARLVVFCADPAAVELPAAAGLTVVTDPAELRREYEVELEPAGGEPPGGDEPEAFTEAELREMEAGGLTLAEAIRAVEAEPPRSRP